MLLPLFLIDALAAVCLLYPFFSSLSPLLSPIFTSFPLDFLFAGSVTATPCHRSTVQHGRLASCAKRTCDVPCFTGLTTACFRHWRRPSCAPFSFGKKEAFGRATSYDCATNQKAPLDSKGAHEARALWAKQREVSPMSKGTLQAARRSRVTIANCG